MPRKKSPITDYALEEEEREAGTLLSTVAKQNRGIYEQFKKVAALRGLKPSEAVMDAIRLWTLSETMRDIDSTTLMTIINFVNYMEEASIKKLLALGKLFTSEFFKFAAGIAQEAVAQTAPAQTEQSKQPSPDEMIKQQMKLQMMQTMIPLYMTIMQQLLKALGNVNIPTQNILPTQTQTQTPKRKVIVE